MNESVERYVTVEHRSGAYIAKQLESSPPRVLVEIIAVLQHPLQGDLHNRYKVDVTLFHERKAAAQREKVWVPAASVQPYEGDVPSYDESLRSAWEELMASMQSVADGSYDRARYPARPELQAWAVKSIEQLRSLEKDYWGSGSS
ncbi:MAG: kinase [Paenibacillus sp.]|jgi:kinase-associated protein B|uniref:sporulation phosphorelay system protein KapB n=1 Tax=Paenibacillus sp. GCM10012303 TaxID=3317340 RepID=UPI0029F3027E|nr:kinase [Paenibacillus sp.]